VDWTLAQKLKANGSELEPKHNASYVAANAQRHVPRGRKGGTGIAQGGNAAMINIRLNVLRLLDDDTITSIQCSCTRRSYSNGQDSKLAHGKHRYDSMRSRPLYHSPEGNGPKLSILHGFQTLSGKARMSFNALGRANPGTTTSEKRQNNKNDDVRKQLQCT